MHDYQKITVFTGILGFYRLSVEYGSPRNPKNCNNPDKYYKNSINLVSVWHGFPCSLVHDIIFFRNLQCVLARKQKLEGYSRRQTIAS